MAGKSTYKTRQMEEMMHFLRNHEKDHFTVQEVCSFFEEHGSHIGTTTVYRRLDRLVEEGIVAKYVIDGTSGACFEYLGEEEHRGSSCYHCKCEQCGRVIHLHCDEVEELQHHMLEHHQFRLNAVRTVFYGLCSDCGNQE